MLINSENKEVNTSDEKMAGRQIIISQTMGIFLVFVITGLIISFVPLSPKLTLDVDIDVDTPERRPTINLESPSYEKVSLTSALTGTHDEVVFDQVTGESGDYKANITIRYKNETISNTTFGELGDGLYQMQLTKLPRTEEPDIPYEIEIKIQYKIHGEIREITEIAKISPK